MSAVYQEWELLQYFDGKVQELELYKDIEAFLLDHFPDSDFQIKKTQISVVNRHLYACISLPVRRKKDWPKTCLLLTLGLRHQVDSPRIAVVTEPYPGRWTHHILIQKKEELDEELLDWVREAYEFAANKR